MLGLSGRRIAITERSGLLPNVDPPRDPCHSHFSGQFGCKASVRQAQSLQSAPGVCDGCPERRVALNLRQHLRAAARPGSKPSAGSVSGGAERNAPDQRLFVSPRHKKQRSPFTLKRKLSKITVAVAGVTV